MLDLVRGLPERGIDVHVALQSRGPLGALLDEAGIPWTPIRTHRWIGSPRGPLRKFRNHVLDALTARRIGTLAKGIGAGLVHTNTLSSPVGAMIAQKAALPHVWHMREAVDTDPGSVFSDGMESAARFIAATTQRVFCVSDFLAGETARYAPSDRIRRLHNGPLNPHAAHEDLPSRRRIDRDGKIRLLLVGGITPRKGQREAIQALALLRDRGLDVHLTLAGDGRADHISDLRKLATELGVDERIEMPGYVDPKPYYADCDLSLLSGPGDPLPRVAIESLANGVPTVALRSGGIPEIVDDRETGWLYDGSPESLAMAIETAILSSPSMIGEMRSEGRKRAFERFNMDRYRNDCVALYREMGVF